MSSLNVYNNQTKKWDEVGTYVQPSGEVWEDIPLNQEGIITNGVLDNDTDYLEFNFDKPYKKVAIRVVGNGTGITTPEQETIIVINEHIDNENATDLDAIGELSLDKKFSQNVLTDVNVECKGNICFIQLIKNIDYNLATDSYNSTKNLKTYGNVSFDKIERIAIICTSQMTSATKFIIQGVAL